MPVRARACLAGPAVATHMPAMVTSAPYLPLISRLSRAAEPVAIGRRVAERGGAWRSVAPQVQGPDPSSRRAFAACIAIVGIPGAIGPHQLIAFQRARAVTALPPSRSPHPKRHLSGELPRYFEVVNSSRRARQAGGVVG